jgi:hypothetical protein
VLGSFAAPPASLRDDADTWRQLVQGAVTGLLTLLGIDADPLSSREHILLSAVLDQRWQQGQNLDLAGLIHAVQEPGMSRIGVMELETFYPAKERFELAMRVNNLLAAPGFAAWMEGEPLDAGRLLYTAKGQPRVSVLSIAHLGDAERMFFVTLLLNAVIAWMRSQPGTTSLRAILYMDEVFGYLPPVANPATKQLLLTLLKQARASAWASCCPRRTRSTSTTRRCRTQAPGSSAACRPSRIATASATACCRRPAATISIPPGSTRSSAVSASATS